MTGARGFTLYELMVGVVVFTIFGGLVTSLTTQAHREHRWAHAYREDLRSCRAALRMLEADVRAGRRVLPAGTSVVVRGPAGDVEYRHENDQLVRIDQQGRRRRWASVGGFELTAEGALAKIVLEVRGRARQAPRPGARLTTRVVLRNGDRR